MTDPELLDIYRRTCWTVRAPSGPVRVRLPGPVAQAALRPAAIVTAYNPASIEASDEANRAADEQLRIDIAARGLDAWRTLAHGVGSDAEKWDEPGWLLRGEVLDVAVDLAARHGQNAIVWIDEKGCASLVCTRDGFCGRRAGDIIPLHAPS